MKRLYLTETIAKNFVIARKCSGLSHLDLVNLSGITRPVISGIENARINTTLDTINKLTRVLGINFEMLILGKKGFDKLYKLLKSQFELEFKGEREIYYPDEIWKSLVRLSGNIDKKNYKKIAALCRKLINLNFPSFSLETKNRMLYSGVQGIIFQEEGFKQGFEFGLWLYIRLFSVSEEEKYLLDNR